MQKTQNDFSIMQRWDKMSREEKTSISLVGIALILGIFVRLVYVFQDDFPINDGGLFYAMVLDLQANGFLIPAVTQYNLSDLPYAYPPLAFYLAGFLNSSFGFDLLSLMRWIPLLFNILAIPVFYHFSKQLLKDPIRAALATLFFALLKPGYEWLIMGGGLTRSPAMFFSLVALDRYLALIQTDEKRTRKILEVAIFYALTFLSHMEIGWFTTYSLALLWFFKGRTWKNFISSTIIAAGAFIATSPYWLQVMQHHSLQPFLAGLFSGGYSPFISVFELFYFNFTEELIFPILATIALIGVVIALIRREYLLPVWLLMNAILDARSVNRSDVIPAAMLISIGIVDGAFFLIRKYTKSKNDQNGNLEGTAGLFTRSGILIIYILCIQVALTAYLARFTDQALTHVLSRDNREALIWIKENTPSDAKFISLPSSKSWETDTVGEWFPTLAERTNLLTVQGSEWQPDYRDRIAKFREISTLMADGELNVRTLMRDFPQADFLFLPVSSFQNKAALVVLRSTLQEFPLIFRNADVEVYRLRGS
jgi:hypothetical protein